MFITSNKGKQIPLSPLPLLQTPYRRYNYVAMFFYITVSIQNTPPCYVATGTFRSQEACSLTALLRGSVTAAPGGSMPACCPVQCQELGSFPPEVLPPPKAVSAD